MSGSILLLVVIVTEDRTVCVSDNTVLVIAFL